VDSDQARRVADRTLDVAPIWRDKEFGLAVRFGNYCNATPYGWQPYTEREDINKILLALRGQLAGLLQGWELIQGGRNVVPVVPVGSSNSVFYRRLFNGFAKAKQTLTGSEVDSGNANPGT
jgi:hypothetical protein